MNVPKRHIFIPRCESLQIENPLGILEPAFLKMFQLLLSVSTVSIRSCPSTNSRNVTLLRLAYSSPFVYVFFSPLMNFDLLLSQSVILKGTRYSDEPLSQISAEIHWDFDCDSLAPSGMFTSCAHSHSVFLRLTSMRRSYPSNTLTAFSPTNLPWSCMDFDQMRCSWYSSGDQSCDEISVKWASCARLFWEIFKVFSTFVCEIAEKSTFISILVDVVNVFSSNSFRDCRSAFVQQVGSPRIADCFFQRLYR